MSVQVQIAGSLDGRGENFPIRFPLRCLNSWHAPRPCPVRLPGRYELCPIPNHQADVDSDSGFGRRVVECGLAADLAIR